MKYTPSGNDKEAYEYNQSKASRQPKIVFNDGRQNKIS
jgi:hypothetical protein